jgi:Divergent InlB B-repeat domain
VAIGLLCAAGVCGGSASGSGVVVTPKCIAAYACAEVDIYGFPPPSGSGLNPGSGRAVSNPGGIDCTFTLGIQSGVCTYTFSWPIGTTPTTVGLTASGTTGTLLCTQACDTASDYSPKGNTGAGYQFTLSPGESVDWDLSFALQKERITVSRTGAGTGAVRSAGGGSATGSAAIPIDCGIACTGMFDYGVPVTLTATPDAGASFTQWTGACAGQPQTCTLSPKAATSTTADFGLAGQTTTTTSKTTTTVPTTATKTTAATTAATAVGHELEAQLIALKSGKSLLGARVEKIEVQAGEKLAATLVLARDGKRLAHASIPGINPGDRVITLPVSGSVAKGRATLTITLTDTSGLHHTWTRIINVPR